ncbi:MAG: lipopolysaccharide biosynthesis protein [Planctomycetota bacterium]
MPSAPRAKFQRDALWNYASVAVLTVCGFGLYVLISRVYDEATLGVFQLVYAVYVFASQLAVGGVDRSVLRAIAEHADDRVQRSRVLVGSLVPTLGIALAASATYYFARDAIAAWFDSPGVARGMAVSAPGLFFFALNKVGLAAVNGLQRMRAFAVYQALRYVLIFAGCLAAVLADLPGEELAIVFTISEGVLFVLLAVEVSRQLAWPFDAGWKSWCAEHVRYGAKSVLSGVLLELNTRVDVLMIGVYLSDTAVGIYAWAVQIADGVFQLLVVLQNVYNPILARHIAAGERAQLAVVVRRGKLWTYAGMVVAGAAAVALYPIALDILTGKPEFAASYPSFAWLMLGVVVASGYIPFAQTLLMAGFPGSHTLYMTLTVGTNVIGNALLIPRFGIAGAAIATAISFALSVVYLRVLVKARVGVAL